jgi:type I restriction enzyme S subunit
MARLGDIFERQIAGEWGSECAENENGTKVLRTTNFTQEGRINYDDVVIRSINQSKVEKKRCHYGDIILEKSGGTEKTPVGRVVFCDEAIEDSIYLCNNFTQAMRVNQATAIPRYVFYFMWNLHSSGKTDLLQNKTTGIRNLQVKSYLNENCPLPALEEQRKIAAVLDKVSDLIAKRRQQLDKLDELVKSRFIEMFGEPENNNKAWPVKSLDKLCTVGSSKRVYQSEQSSEGVPFWRISDLVSKIHTGTVDSELFISEIKYTELKRAGLVPVTGNILVTSRGTLGRCYIVHDEDCFYFQDGMISWLSNYSEEITPLYLQYLFTMSGFRKQIDNTQAGSTVAYLSIAMLKKLQVMVPNKALQEQFAAFVAQTDKSKLAIQKSLEKLEILKKALMQKYFG